jgi:MFS family permease
MLPDRAPDSSSRPAARPRPAILSSEKAREAPAPRPLREVGDTFRALRHRNYRLYFFGQLVSLTGSWIQTTALMWVAYDLTRQTWGPAVVSAVGVLPTSLLGAWGGALADRWSKRTVLLVTQATFLVLALLLAGLVVGGPGLFWPLVVITAVTGLVQAVDLPARLAFVMDMVGREDLINAVALNSLLFNMARAAGPALAGWLLIWMGPALCFAVNALSFAAVVWALWLMEGVPATAASATGRKARPFKDSLGQLIGRPGLALLLLLAGVLALCGWPFLSLLPALADQVLADNARGYSLMLSGTGFGALAAALAVARYGSLDRRRWLIGFGVGTASAGLVGLGLTASLAVAVGCCALAGFGLVLFFATCQSIVQLSAPDESRGSVMGTWAMLLSAAIPLGNLLASQAAKLWGEPWVLGLEGLICGLAALGILLLYLVWDRYFDKPNLPSAGPQPPG